MKRILALILALLLLCSCAQAPKTGKMSEKNLENLREKYPYLDVHPLRHLETIPEEADYHYPDGYWDLSELFNDAISYDELFLVAAIEIQSEPYYKTIHKDYPGTFKDLDDFMQQYPDLSLSTATLIFEQGSMYVDALITEVLCGNSSLKVGETFDLTNSYWFWGQNFEDIMSLYAKGNRLVCYLVQPASVSAGIHANNAHWTSEYFTWYLTKDDVVLSIHQGPGPDSFSGLYLESFKQEVQAIWEKYNKE